jgi:hypothetical protein
MTKIAVLLCISIFLNSCGGTAHLLQEGKNGRINYEIKSYYGCCGCTAFYYNIFENRMHESQFVWEVNCGFGQPTKFIFKNDEKGNRIATDTCIFVTDTTYEILLTELEKKLFLKLDSMRGNMQFLHLDSTMKFSSFTGIRKPRDNERTHPFVISK